MPQITLKKKQLDEFAAFIRKHDVKKWFLAKDQGAYVGACGGSQEDGTFENILFYFNGCNPNTDEDFWENGQAKFGGDDFGEQFPVDVILDLADDPLTTKMVVNVGKTSISMKSWARKAPAPQAPKAPKAPKPKAPKNVQKMTKGEQIRQLLAEGVDVDTIVGMVGTTANSVRWHKSKMMKEAA